MRGTGLLIVMVILSGCTRIIEIDRPENEKDENIWAGPGLIIDGERENILYVSGLEYPEGYDWKGGGDIENVRCSLAVFADGAPMLKIPVGDGHEVSPDPDMHRIVAGHLYTFFSGDSHTVVKKDGKTLLKYVGKEIIADMIVNDNDIYTLGIPHSGEGFIYRKNGTSVIERKTGYAFGRLHIDAGKICFAFCQPVTTSSGNSDSFYMARNGVTTPVWFSKETSRVWDLMSHDGQTCALVSAGPWNTMELIDGEEEKVIILPYGAEMLSCRLFAAGSSIGTEGLYSYGGDRLFSGIWIDGGQYMLFETGLTLSAVTASEEEVCCILNPESSGRGMIFKSGRTYMMPEGYSCIGNNPAAIHEGNLYVGLSSMTGASPIIWKNNRHDTLKFNGPICSLSISSPE